MTLLPGEVLLLRESEEFLLIFWTEEFGEMDVGLDDVDESDESRS